MSLIFSHAIVRKPGRSVVNGLSTSGAGVPVYEDTLVQHSEYIRKLKECGLTVNILDPEEEFPDSVFIEDVALCTSRFAVITNPGAQSRKGEIKGMNNVLKEYYENIEAITDPGTLEAGDVMMAGDHFFIGVSDRTNLTGAEQLIRILEKYGFTGSKIRLSGMLHLKSGVSYLENNVILVIKGLAGIKEFNSFRKILVPDSEGYAANSVWLNGTVIVPDGFPETKRLIEENGYNTIVTDVSEFRKLDGGLSCLSLRF